MVAAPQLTKGKRALLRFAPQCFSVILQILYICNYAWGIDVISNAFQGSFLVNLLTWGVKMECSGLLHTPDLPFIIYVIMQEPITRTIIIYNWVELCHWESFFLYVIMPCTILLLTESNYFVLQRSWHAIKIYKDFQVINQLDQIDLDTSTK